MLDLGYPRAYAIRIMALDAISTIVGLALFAAPFALGWYPGAFDTMLHVTFGAMIATLAAFRVLLAYGSSWVEIVLIALGVLVLRLPHFNHMEWNATYTSLHMAAGGIVIVIGIISGLMTMIEMKKTRPAH